MDNTTVEKKTFTNETDDTLLLVKGHTANRNEEKFAVKKLSRAIVEVVNKHKVANLRCVGAAAISKATKAAIVASGNLSQKDVKVLIDPSFQTVQFDNVEKTAINLKVVVVD